MKTLFTKHFHFSASFSKGERVIGHNYVLGVTFPAQHEDAERVLVDKIEALVRPMESRDLGTDVEFFKGADIDDQTLLKIFWPLAERAIAPVSLESLSLERDRRTMTTLFR
jgi:hypothetical protein